MSERKREADGERERGSKSERGRRGGGGSERGLGGDHTNPAGSWCSQDNVLLLVSI